MKTTFKKYHRKKIECLFKSENSNIIFLIVRMWIHTSYENFREVDLNLKGVKCSLIIFQTKS